MGRKKAFPTRWRVAALLLLAGLFAAGWGWWQFIHWSPPRDAWPVQGVLVSAQDGKADFRAFRAIGADFAYLEASRGGARRDPAFAENLASVRAAGLQFGAVHHYDPCVAADVQAANFLTVVPRDSFMLPPAIELDETADSCTHRVSDAEVESELTTFLNQIEGHAGKPALLKISEAFDARHHIASAIERNLWLERDRFQPEYAGRPWTLWTANSELLTQAGAGAVRWVVVQP